MKPERWKEYFEDKLNPQIIADPSVLNSFPINDREPQPPLLKSETEAAIRSLKRGKAPGPDGITAELINIDSEDVVKLYHKVVSAVWSTGHVPQLWCNAAVVPIHKKGSRRECENYHHWPKFSYVESKQLQPPFWVNTKLASDLDDRPLTKSSPFVSSWNVLSSSTETYIISLLTFGKPSI